MSRAFPPAPTVSARSSRLVVVLTVTAVLFTGLPRSAAAGPPAATAAPVTGSTGVFAIDNDHHTVVFIPVAGGAPRPVAAGLTAPTQIAASRAGSVFVVDGTRLLKVTPRGVVQTIRTSMAPRASIAVDDNNWLFVLDGSTIVKYSPLDGSLPVAVGTAPADDYAVLTVDAVGNASLTGPPLADYLSTVITTYPVRGGTPTSRTLVADYNHSQTFFKDPSGVIEARDGTIYLETSESGGSGATDLYRVPPGPAGTAVAFNAKPVFSEYAYGVDAGSRFYLLQNRSWCTAVSRDEGACVDDYGVDVVQRYASPGTGRVDTPVTGVDLPVGGISVASSGAIYAAVLVSRSARDANSTAVPRMLRIDPAGGGAVVLAQGHFSMPVAENFRFYGG